MDMQMSFGVYECLSDARCAWEAIRATGLFTHTDGAVVALSDAELVGAWTIESYAPGEEPLEMTLQHCEREQL